MISSDGIRGYNDMMILCLILSEPSYGYQISREIKSRTEEKYVIKETTLYSAFTRLEKNGYIELRQRDKRQTEDVLPHYTGRKGLLPGEVRRMGTYKGSRRQVS